MTTYTLFRQNELEEIVLLKGLSENQALKIINDEIEVMALFSNCSLKEASEQCDLYLQVEDK